MRLSVLLAVLLAALLIAGGALAQPRESPASSLERVAIPTLASARGAGAREPAWSAVPPDRPRAVRGAGGAPRLGRALCRPGAQRARRALRRLGQAPQRARLRRALPRQLRPAGLARDLQPRRAPVDGARGRPEDAEAALAWLAREATVRPDAIGVIGWSNGAITVLALVDAARRRGPERDPHPPAFRAAVAFYPGCRAPLARGDWTSRVPLGC
jgi:hypothetical protein